MNTSENNPLDTNLESGESPQRTLTTRPTSQEHYQKGIKACFQFSRKLRTTDMLEPAWPSYTEMASDMLSRTDIQSASKNNYRSALLWDLRSKQALNEDELVALQLLEAEKKPVGTDQKKKTRQKTITEKDYELLLTELAFAGEKSVWSRRARMWLRAGIVTGIRPIEWLNTDWANPEQSKLLVKTAKVKIADAAFIRAKNSTEDKLDGEKSQQDRVSNTASHPNSLAEEEQPHYRTIPIEKENLRAVQDHLLAIQYESPEQWPEAKRLERFKKYFDGCRQALAITCKKIWKGEKTFSLYTMRSQFSANTKASKGNTVTAELMGHSRPDSPSAGYYGHGSQAHKQFKKNGGQRQKQTEQLIFLATDAPGSNAPEK